MAKRINSEILTAARNLNDPIESNNVCSVSFCGKHSAKRNSQDAKSNVLPNWFLLSTAQRQNPLKCPTQVHDQS